MSERHATTLLRALLPRPAWLGLGGLAGLLAAAWVLPGSPVTLWRADAAVGRDASAAVALYDDVGDWGWTPGLRATALDRAATLLATDLARPAQARGRLEALAGLRPDPSVHAALRERIGHLWLTERDPAEAGAEFLAAYASAPTARRAPQRLILAARSFAEARQPDVAARLWRELADAHPSQRAVARLAQARAALTDGDPQKALRLFDEARQAARTPDQEAAARLGVATSLERLGSLDEAIAEIDAADLPGGVRESRVDSLRARRDERDR